MLTATLFPHLVAIIAGQICSDAGYCVEVGPEEIVYDGNTMGCFDGGSTIVPDAGLVGSYVLIDDPDLPARAFVDATGRVQLIAGDNIQYRNVGDNLNRVSHDCSGPVYASHLDPIPRDYQAFEWVSATYTLDGQTVYGLVHNEYHGWQFPGPYAGTNCEWPSFLGSEYCLWDAMRNLSTRVRQQASEFRLAPVQSFPGLQVY
jgi:hypothetical protein